MPQGARSTGGGGGADKTTAIPVHRQAKPKADPDSTKKLPSQNRKPAQEPEDDQRRRGSGVSAQDLLRREGRL
jgi:RND superfamily putative drug exporter